MEDLIPNKCNYENLLSYKKTKVIFELTYYFCHTYLSKGDRTIDQMIQAARSGKQNIVEGCAASPTSAKTEIRLISVAKASLQELLEDFKDYLSTHNHRQWEMDSKEMAAMRRIGKEHTDANFLWKLPRLDRLKQLPIWLLCLSSKLTFCSSANSKRCLTNSKTKVVSARE